MITFPILTVKYDVVTLYKVGISWNSWYSTALHFTSPTIKEQIVSKVTAKVHIGGSIYERINQGVTPHK